MTRRHQASSKHKDISQDTLGARYTLFISHSDFLSAGGQTSCSAKDGSTGIRGQELYLIKLPSLYCLPLYSLARTMLNLFLHRCKAIGGPHLQPCQQDFRENSKRPRHNRSLWEKCFSHLLKWTVFNFPLRFFSFCAISFCGSIYYIITITWRSWTKLCETVIQVWMFDWFQPVCQFVVLLLASAFLLHKETKYFWHYVKQKG